MRSIPAKYEPTVTAVGAALLSLVLALVYYRSWILHLDVPIDLTGDAVQKLELATSAVRHGWLLDLPSIGLPGQGQHFDFPRYDSLNYALIKVFAWVTGNAIVATNLFFLLGYPLIALSTCLVLRALGISSLYSFVGALAYAWFPYHQLRGFQQFTNAAYVLVPVAFLFLREVWYAEPDRVSWSRKRWVAWIAFGIALELQNPYYGVFFSVLALSVGLLLGALRGFRSSRTALVRTGIVLGVIGLTFAAEQLPRWLFEAAHGKNALAVVRPPSGVSEFALSIADLVNPSPDHPIDRLAKWTQYAATMRGYKYNERVVATLPFIGLFGLVVALAALIGRARRLAPGDARARLRQWAGAMILVSLAWCHEGGLCTLLSETGFGLIRGWNRMSIFIGFATILAAVSWLEGIGVSWSRWVQRSAGALVLILCLAEQLFATSRNSFPKTAARLNEARQLTGEISADGKLHRAFIVPYLDYPEAGKTGAIQDYDHFMLNIASPRLAISYGSMRGRGGYYFSSGANALHGAELSAYLRDAGFDTIIADTLSTESAALREELAVALGAPISRTPRFLAYRIAESADAAPTEAAWRGYALGSNLNFRDAATRRFLELNFSVYEPDGTWTIGPLAALRLSTESLPNTLVLKLQGALFEDPKKPQRVQVLFDGEPVCAIDRTNAAAAGSHQWSCRFTPKPTARAAGPHEIRFQIEQPVSPKMLKQSADERLLGFRLVSLALDVADGAGS